MADVSTSNVVVSRSGTGFTVDVTACNLLSDLTVTDFIILHNNIPYSPLSNYTKTSTAVLTYTGATLPTNTTVEVRRKTPPAVVRDVLFGERMVSNLWNQELDRKSRWQAEADLNGAGAAFNGVIPTPRNDAYGVIWSGDTTFPPSRNSVYDKIQTLAPLTSPAFLGAPTTPTAAASETSTIIASTAFVKNVTAAYAPLVSPSLTGTPTAPTAAATTNNTQLATTAFVKASTNKDVWYITKGTVQTLSTTYQAATVLFDTVIRNPLSAYNTATGVYTANEPGFYLINAGVRVALTGAGTTSAGFGASFIVDGIPVALIGEAYPTDSAAAVSGSLVVFLGVGSTVLVRVSSFNARTGGSASTGDSTNAYLTYFNGIKLSTF